MKKFYQPLFAMAAIFAIFFAVSCDNGSTSPSGASFVGSEGDALEWIPVGGGTSRWTIMQANGIPTAPSETGFYTTEDTVPASQVYAAEANKVVPADRTFNAGDIYKVIKITNSISAEGYAIATDASTLTTTGSTSANKYIIDEEVARPWYRVY